MRKISSVLTLILVVCLSIGGVSAAWVYADGAASGFKDFLVSMGTWKFGYTISFVNNGENLITPINVTDNSQDFVIMNKDATGIDNVVNTDAKTAAQKAETDMGDGYEFSHWINAGSTRIDSIPADNDVDYTLFPSFVGKYTASYVYQDGTVLEYDYYTSNDASAVIAKVEEATAKLNQKLVDDGISEDLELDYWEIRFTKDGKETHRPFIKYNVDSNSYEFMDSKGNALGTFDASQTTEEYTFGDQVDMAIYPVLLYKGDVSLNPVDENNDGITDYYEVTGYNNPDGQELVEIPDKVNGKEVTDINSEAFSSFDNLYAVKIPCTVTSVENKAFADTSLGSWGRDTVTLYVDLDIANGETVDNNDWTNALNGSTDTDLTLGANWDHNMGQGSRIFFLDENGKVINKGYWELERSGRFGNYQYTWKYHDHAYVCNSSYNCSLTHTQNDTDYIGDTKRTDIDRKYWNDTYQ